MSSCWHVGRRHFRKLSLLGFVLLVAGFGTSFLQQASADAWSGRAAFNGYFSNVNSPSYCTGYRPARCGDQNDVLPPGVVRCGADTRALPTRCVSSVNQLITILSNYNRTGGSASRERASSAFIFWSLQGYDAAYANGHGGRTIPGNYRIAGVPGTGFTALENLLNAELADGQISINWSANPTLFPRTYSEYNAGTRLADVAQDTQDGPQTGEAIEFRNNSTGKIVYSLFRDCGNPGGLLTGLPAYNPPVTYQCGNASSTPGFIQPTDNFTVKVNDTYANGAPAYTAFHVSIPGIGYTNNNATPVARTGTSLSFTTATMRAPPQAGTYTVNWQLFNGGTADGPACTGTFSVTNLPYFTAFGADVAVGGNFQPACGTTGGTLGGWYNNQAGKFAGANTLLSVIAAQQVTGFASAEARTGTNSRDTGLTFANNGGGAISTDGTSPKLGGNYGGSHCFYTPTAPAGAASPGGSNFTVNPAATGAYRFNAAQFTLNSGSVGVGKNVAVYVNGNVRITGGGIQYAGSGGGWTMQPDGTSNVPSFVLEASGNIYIDSSVTGLDGIYVAHGTIYTCDNGGFAPRPAAGIYGSCNHQLVVNGSFTAQQINLMRSIGTLNQANAGENLSGGTKPCVNDAAREVVCAAEVFNFSPETYLSNPAVAPPSNGATTYDAITSLPPVL